jgi:hypothetical protein
VTHYGNSPIPPNWTCVKIKEVPFMVISNVSMIINKALIIAKAYWI